MKTWEVQNSEIWILSKNCKIELLKIMADD